MQLGVEQSEVIAEQVREAVGVITVHGQPAASLRTLWAESGDDEEPAIAERPEHRLQVRVAIRGLDHEMEDRTVVPKDEPAAEVMVADVGLHERNASGVASELTPHLFQGSTRDVATVTSL